MSRKAGQKRRECKPDPRYGSITLAKFINKVMMKGKKSLAQTIVYDALDTLSESVKEGQLQAFEKALRHAMPLMEVRSRRVGGSTYQVPVEVRADRATALSMRWIIKYSRERSGRSMVAQLASELIDVYNKVGATIKKREETHKMAEANKAFAHFKW